MSYRVSGVVDTQPPQTSALAVAARKWLILAAALGFFAAYAGSYLMEPAYRAEIVTIPTEHSGQESLLAGLANQTGALGVLAGLPDYSSREKSEFIETLHSSGMERKFIREQGLVRVFCKTKIVACDKEGDSSAESNENAALRAFDRQIFGVSEDKRTGVVRVTMTWTDRNEAASWANAYVALTNRELQGRAVTEARQRVAFLEKAVAATEDQELRSAIYRLVESEVKLEMLASTRPDYAFRVIDPAVPPDRRDKVRPLRAVVALVGAMFAVSLMFCGALVIGYFRRARRTDAESLRVAPHQ